MRLLVIEDEPKIAAYVVRLLQQIGGIADIVGTLSDAHCALGSFKYDLAVVDRTLADGDALEIVTSMRAAAVRPAIIMLTARDDKEDVIYGLNAGADDYLGKPFEPQELFCEGPGFSSHPSCRLGTSNSTLVPTKPPSLTTRYSCAAGRP